MAEKATVGVLWDVDFQPGLDYRRANLDGRWEFAFHFSPSPLEMSLDPWDSGGSRTITATSNPSHENGTEV